jgi:hypothetical protein
MALARIRTHFPEEVSELCDALIEAGYVVETVRPEEFKIAPADLELTVEKFPVIEAWRHIPDANSVFVAPGTPESRDIRSAIGKEISREPLVAKLVVDIGERYSEFSRWSSGQFRELRSRVHEIRQRWTPPREYHAAIHLEPAAPSSMEHSNETRIVSAIEQARLAALKKTEERRRREEAERLRLAEQARVLEDNRRRAREAAEAKALLEEQKKIEAMVRATETLRERVVRSNLPAPRPIPVPRPRHVLRTRRERAFVRAGVAAFAMSLGLAVLAGEALHPRPASAVIPQVMTRSTALPFAKQDGTSMAAQSPTAATKPFSAVSSFIPVTPAATAPAEAHSVLLNATSIKPRRLADESRVAEDDVVIVRKMRTQHPASKSKNSVIHYSDLD